MHQLQPERERKATVLLTTSRLASLHQSDRIGKESIFGPKKTEKDQVTFLSWSYSKFSSKSPYFASLLYDFFTV